MNLTQVTVLSEKIPVITPKQVVDKLRRYAVERQIALKHYPSNYSNSEKINATMEIIALLDEADNCLSSTECIKKVLKTTLNFHFIAPRNNKKEFATWYNKIEGCMISCREFLHWSCQFSA